MERVDGSCLDEADVACLFRDHKDDTVVVFGDSYGGAMTEAVVAWDFVVVGDWQDASGRHNLIVGDDHGTIVKGAVFEEDVLYQRFADDGIDGHAGDEDIGQGVLSGDDDEGTLFDVAHRLAGLADGVGVECDGFLFAVEETEEFQVAVAGLGSDGEQESPDLGLEDNDEGNEAHAHEGTQDGGEQLHLQGVDELPDQEDGDDADEDADGGGAFKQSIERIKQHRHQYDVDDVNYSNLNEEVQHRESVMGYLPPCFLPTFSTATIWLPP